MSGTGSRPGIIFWIVVLVALVWNGMTFMNFFMQMNAEMLKTLPEQYQALVENRPGWATAAFGLAGLFALLGAVLLGLRKRIAYPCNVVAFLFLLLTLMHAAPYQLIVAGFSFGDNIMTIALPALLAIFMVWYSHRARENGWLR